jgi:cob(I)alamin adenosyltransferase
VSASRIYTRTGDDDETGLFGDGRTLKSDARMSAYGEVDELNALLGLTILRISDGWTRWRLQVIQADLFVLGAHLATPPAPDGRRSPQLPSLPEERVGEMERWMDEASAALPDLRTFILPGGSEGGAALHLARTVCRRAEREVVALAAGDVVHPAILAYLNRLSDFLFVAARRENALAGAAERPWTP